MVQRLFGRFIPGATLLHILDLRVKLIGMGILVSIALAADNWLDIAAIAMFVLMTVGAARMPIGELWRDIKGLRLFYLITIILHSILSSGQPLVQLPFNLAITVQGIERG